MEIEFDLNNLNDEQLVFLQLAYSAAGNWDTDELACATEYVINELADKPKDNPFKVVK